MFKETDAAFTPMESLPITDQQRSALNSSRARLVGEVIYPNINESRYAPLFSSVDSRPNIPVRRYVCALILERMYGLTDEQFLEFLRAGALNLQYALHTVGEESQPLSERSLRRFRRKLWQYEAQTGHDLLKEDFTSLSRQMGVSMGVLPADRQNLQDEDGNLRPLLYRMDSLLIEAHAKAMTRLEIIYMTNLSMIRRMLKTKMDAFLPDGLAHYLEEEDHNRVVYYACAKEEKALEQETRVARAIHEMELLKTALDSRFPAEYLEGFHEYQVLCRVLEEQSYPGPDGRRIPKDKGDIPASSVQNPFDDTVTYRRKGGSHHGSVMNIVEAHNGKGDGVVIDASVRQNTVSDRQLAREFLESLPDDGPEAVMVSDGAYASPSMEELARQKNIRYYSTSLTGNKGDPIFAEFAISEDGTRVLSCPEGHVPTSCEYNRKYGRITAKMPGNCCSSCPNRERCKAKVNQKKGRSTVRVTVSQVSTARHPAWRASEEGRRISHQRNAIEGIMAVLRQKYRVDHIPVFGLHCAKLWLWASLVAYNIGKLQKFLQKTGASALPAVAL